MCVCVVSVRGRPKSLRLLFATFKDCQLARFLFYAFFHASSFFFAFQNLETGYVRGGERERERMSERGTTLHIFTISLNGSTGYVTLPQPQQRVCLPYALPFPYALPPPGS